MAPRLRAESLSYMKRCRKSQKKKPLTSFFPTWFGITFSYCSVHFLPLRWFTSITRSPTTFNYTFFLFDPSASPVSPSSPFHRSFKSPTSALSSHLHFFKPSSSFPSLSLLFHHLHPFPPPHLGSVSNPLIFNLFSSSCISQSLFPPPTLSTWTGIIPPSSHHDVYFSLHYFSLPSCHSPSLSSFIDHIYPDPLYFLRFLSPRLCVFWIFTDIIFLGFIQKHHSGSLGFKLRRRPQTSVNNSDFLTDKEVGVWRSRGVNVIDFVAPGQNTDSSNGSENGSAADVPLYQSTVTWQNFKI